MEETFNTLEATILRILEGHQGKDNAISRAELVEFVRSSLGDQVDVNERWIRETIKHLVTQHGVRIGSCHRGYFLVETTEELEAVCKYYHSYGLSSLYVEARLRNLHLAELLGQLAIDVGRATAPAEKVGTVADPTK